MPAETLYILAEKPESNRDTGSSSGASRSMLSWPREDAKNGWGNKQTINMCYITRRNITVAPKWTLDQEQKRRGKCWACTMRSSIWRDERFVEVSGMWTTYSKEKQQLGVLKLQRKSVTNIQGWRRYGNHCLCKGEGSKKGCVEEKTDNW